MKIFLFVIVIIYLIIPIDAFSHVKTDSLPEHASLTECIRYALAHQPLIHQSDIDEKITENTIKSSLADWYPQVNLTYDVQHFIELPTSFFPDPSGVKRPVRIGQKNTSNIQLSVNQSIFNPNLLLANRTVRDIRKRAQQTTTSNKINLVVEVSKAYYDLLLTQKQVLVLDENILRLERSLKDAFNQYEGGIVDKTDYKRARIALNNTIAERKRAEEVTKAKNTYLKQLMGYDTKNALKVIYDSLAMEKEVFIDTLMNITYGNRIENQLLQSQQALLNENLRYHKLSFLPSVSASGAYTPTFQNDRLSNLYASAYPSSFVGLQLSVPIFQGNKRVYNIRNANLQLLRLKWDLSALNSQIDAEYSQALAAYKGNFAEWSALKENLGLAEDVYATLRLQYAAGIKTYLDVIIAETDLRSAQLNYLNALYEVLASKLDMERALGVIKF